MTEKLRRYTFKLYPTKLQDAALHEQRKMMADLWNALLQQRELAAEGVYCPLVKCFAPPPIIAGETRDERKERLIAEQKARRERQKTARAHKTAIPISARGKHVDGRISQAWEIGQLLASQPQWRALSTWTPRAVADNIHKAFQAFFRRAKEGAGAQSGYPKFRSRNQSTTIPYRCVSGCQLVPRVREGSNGPPNAETARAWSLILKGVPGPIRVRGEFPAAPLDYKDANIIWRDDAWWLSICVEMAPRRTSGTETLTVRFDLIDEFARVESAEGQRLACALVQSPKGRAGRSGKIPRPDTDQDAGSGEQVTTRAMASAAILMERVDIIKSERDKRAILASGQRMASASAQSPKGRAGRYRRETRRAARLSSKATRIRREALHCWSTAIVGKAKDLTVIAPPVKAATASPRGDAKNWGAAVEPVSALNRNTLNQAPALAISMLAYKAAEAGIRCDQIVDETPKIAIAEHLVRAVKTHRRLRQKIKRITA